jgi:hypothetical protein
MFYEAMLTSHVPTAKAKVMYAAVYHFGPRWDLSVMGVYVNSEESNDATIAAVTDTLGASGSIPTVVSSSEIQLAGPKERILGLRYIAPKPNLSQKQFRALARMIERREAVAPNSVSLEEIRSYGTKP